VSFRISLLSVLILAFFASSMGVSADEFPDALYGSYRFSGGSAERRAFSDEIDRVADQFGFVARGFARRRMHGDILIENGVTIADRDGEPTFRFDDRRSIVCDGTWQTVDGSGDETGTGKCLFRNGRLHFDERFEDTRTFHVFTLSRDARTLRMSARLENPRLPDTLRYRLTYRRQGGAGAR
jgi:hypothetical protein